MGAGNLTLKRTTLIMGKLPGPFLFPPKKFMELSNVKKSNTTNIANIY